MNMNMNSIQENFAILFHIIFSTHKIKRINFFLCLDMHIEFVRLHKLFLMTSPKLANKRRLHFTDIFLRVSQIK